MFFSVKSLWPRDLRDTLVGWESSPRYGNRSSPNCYCKRVFVVCCNTSVTAFAFFGLCSNTKIVAWHGFFQARVEGTCFWENSASAIVIKGYKKPHGKKEVKPWGNKRRLRYFISRLGNYFFLRKNAILFNEKKYNIFCENKNKYSLILFL